MRALLILALLLCSCGEPKPPKPPPPERPSDIMSYSTWSQGDSVPVKILRQRDGVAWFIVGHYDHGEPMVWRRDDAAGATSTARFWQRER